MRPYDNSRTVANEHEILAEFKRTSLVSYQKFTHIADIQYGKHSRSTLDLWWCFKKYAETKQVEF